MDPGNYPIRLSAGGWCASSVRWCFCSGYLKKRGRKKRKRINGVDVNPNQIINYPPPSPSLRSDNKPPPTSQQAVETTQKQTPTYSATCTNPKKKNPPTPPTHEPPFQKATAIYPPINPAPPPKQPLTQSTPPHPTPFHSKPPIASTTPSSKQRYQLDKTVSLDTNTNLFRLRLRHI